MTVLVAGERFVGINTTVGLEPLGMVQESTRYLVKVFFQSARLIRAGTSCTVEFPSQQSIVLRHVNGSVSKEIGRWEI